MYSKNGDALCKGEVPGHCVVAESFTHLWVGSEVLYTGASPHLPSCCPFPSWHRDRGERKPFGQVPPTASPHQSGPADLARAMLGPTLCSEVPQEREFKGHLSSVSVSKGPGREHWSNLGKLRAGKLSDLPTALWGTGGWRVQEESAVQGLTVVRSEQRESRKA